MKETSADLESISCQTCLLREVLETAHQDNSKRKKERQHEQNEMKLLDSEFSIHCNNWQFCYRFCRFYFKLLEIIKLKMELTIVSSKTHAMEQ